MPVINVNVPLRIPGEDGKYIPLLDSEKKPLTLKKLCFKACANAQKIEIRNGQGVQLSGEDIFHRAYLAQRFFEAKDTIDLESKDVTLVKELISQVPGDSTWITLVCWQLLEGKPQPGDEPTTITTDPNQVT